MGDGSFLHFLDDLMINTGFGFIWFAMLAVWGGTASYISRIKKTRAAFSLIELIGEWTISAFAGVITAYVCYELGFSFYATAALAGVSGHMGAKTLTFLESWAESMWRRFFGG